MFEFLPVILKNAFRKPATRNYPFVVRAPYEKQKGHIEIDLPACIYCGMCDRKCPPHAIKVTRAEKTWSIDRFKCIMCGACIECCPKKCLSMGTAYSPAATAKTIDVFKMPAPDVEKEAAVAGKEENRGA